MKRLSVIMGCILLSPLLAHAGEDQATHEYRGWIENQTLVIKEPAAGSTEGTLVIGGDAIYKTQFCDEDSDYFCFTSQSYAFAVPKRLRPGVSSRTVEGITFEVVRENMEVSLFGSRVSGLLMVKLAAGAKYGAEPTDRDAFYLYSPERGLVAFGFDPAYPYATTYWMEGSKGFGAANEDVARSP